MSELRHGSAYLPPDRTEIIAVQAALYKAADIIERLIDIDELGDDTDAIDELHVEAAALVEGWAVGRFQETNFFPQGLHAALNTIGGGV